MLPTLFLHYRPAPPLDLFVEHLWYWEGASAREGKDRLMPDGSAGLIINLMEDEVRNYVGEDARQVERYSGAVLVGASSRHSVIDTREQRGVLGVSFKPGGMWPFFDLAADELLNAHADLADVWPSSGRSLRARILEQATPAARLRCLERELIAQAVRPLARRPEVDYALNQFALPSDAISIERLSERSGLSARRFTRLFAIEVGLTPKLFARVLRFRRMFGQLGAQVDWSSLAIQCGYFDQSHLIRDCKAMSGLTPSVLQSRWTGTNRHVPM